MPIQSPNPNPLLKLPLMSAAICAELDMKPALDHPVNSYVSRIVIYPPCVAPPTLAKLLLN